MKHQELNTPLGPMLAIADAHALYLLKFVNSNLKRKKLEHTESGWTTPLRSIEKELNAYFKGESANFHTPIMMHGTPFQKAVWKALISIPFGQTCTYTEIARQIGRPKAIRAVANANGANPLAILVPCHRIIPIKEGHGGYAGGVTRKKWLLDLESEIVEKTRRFFPLKLII